MSKYVITKKAISDLSEIWNYTFDRWSENQADKYYQIITDSFQEIADNPDIGGRYEEIADELCGLRVGRHIVFYRKIQFERKEIEITRILHERMDLKNRMKE